MSRIARFLPLLVVLPTAPTGVMSAPRTVDLAQLGKQLAPFLQCISGRRDSFAVSAEIDVPVGERKQRVSVQLDRIDAESFRLEIRHKDYWLRLDRRADQTAFVLPLHKVAFVGTGTVAGPDNLKPQGITGRLLSPNTMATVYWAAVSHGEPSVASLMLTGLLKLQYDSASASYSHGSGLRFQFGESEGSLTLHAGDIVAQVEVHDRPDGHDTPITFAGMKTVPLDRAELERHLVRGAKRALEVLAPSPALTSPARQNRRVEHGELRWIDGHRIVLLDGTPEQVGRAHGTLLRAEAGRCMDSVLHMFGIVQTVRTGRWFPHDLRAAYERLAPHIPADHTTETVSLAKAVGWNSELVQVLNVFPELFHCSGFAVFGKATKDGKLYHGRVLDYMTTIGLQDSAVTFVIAGEGKIPFASVGYGGFIGSVSGMNAKAISLGEMGGGGEGKWDGVPMTSLMRRALEECSTLAEVETLWKNSPRTCEYYYVFADGKTNAAVGVAATPESIEFVRPGQAHPLLGDGIEDAVVLSAGKRLETLRARVKQRYGQIDTGIAQWLMSRPVAMSSNLHDVLFVPADGMMYVAQASHSRPAAERPYVTLDLHELLRSMNRELPAAGSGD